MVRKTLTALVMVAVILGFTTNTKQNEVNAQKNDKITICHRTAATNNPYVKQSVAESSVNGSGPGDHYANHKGPVFPAIGSDGKWGDIIPPVSPYHQGLNWTAEGQAIWNNDCKPVPSKAVISVEATCATNEDKAIVKVFFANSGNADGVADLNGRQVVVPMGTTVVEYLPVKSQVIVSVDQKVVYAKTFDCTPGQGGGITEPQTPVTTSTSAPTSTVKPKSVTALPFTANKGLVAISLISGSAILVTALSSLIKRRLINL